MSYTKLANSILTSTIWMEDDETRIVWLTLLAMADKNGEVQASIPGLANVARVSVQGCHAAIDKFLAPDPYSRTKDDEGRRIEEIRGGWSLINHAEYRNLASDEDRKQKAAERQRRCRDRAMRNSDERECHKMSHQNSQAEAEAEADIKKQTHDAVASDIVLKPKRKRSSESKDHDSEFETFWNVYPVKVAKGLARTAWKKAIKKTTGEKIINAAERYKQQKKRSGDDFIKHPSTWLNAESWEDEEKQEDKIPFEFDDYHFSLPNDEQNARYMAVKKWEEDRDRRLNR
jgi:hypothetical protein